MKYLQEVPRDLEANLDWRGRINFECRKKSGVYRRAVLRMCEQDPLFWINAFVFQFNPLILGGEAGPFILWPSQEKALAGAPGILGAMTMGYDLTVQKSREEGGSYLVVLAMMHGWRFKRRKKYLMISHKEELVWNPGDHDALFSKAEYVLENLPEWMRGGWQKNNFDHWRKRFAYCPESKGVWTGLATTKKVTIGGRYSAILFDEFAHIEIARSIRGRTKATSRCRIFVSTHAGAGTEFAVMCEDPKIAKVVLHWTDHPRKNPGMYRWDHEKQQPEVLDKSYQYGPDFEFVQSGEPTGGVMPNVRSPWYDAECHGIGDLGTVGEELDINPAGSVKQVFDPVLIGQLALRAESPWWTGELAFDDEEGQPIGLVSSPAGYIKLWGIKPIKDGFVPAGIYAAAADIAQGTGYTPSSFVLGDVERRAKVCEICRSDLDPREFASLCVAMCRLFKTLDGIPAKMIFEKTGPTGSSFEKKCLELRFNRLWERPTLSKFKTTTNVVKYGWLNQGDELGKLLNEYHLDLKRRHFYNPSKSALKQALNFRKNKKGKPEHPPEVPAPEGVDARFVHGDVVIADAMLDMMFTDMGGPGEAVREAPEREEPCNPMSLNWRWQLAEQQRLEALEA